MGDGFFGMLDVRRTFSLASLSVSVNLVLEKGNGIVGEMVLADTGVRGGSTVGSSRTVAKKFCNNFRLEILLLL